MELSEFFYTVGQVAKLLDVSRITVWRWAKEGKFNAQFIGREALIPRWEVEILREKRGLHT
jgi:excisionase family DNA binding protein